MSYLMLEDVHREAYRYQAIIMQSTVLSASPIHDLNVELVKIYDTNYIKLTLNGTCLYMKPPTAFSYLNNVLNMYSMNWVNMHGVSKKFEYFVSFLRQNCITNKSDVANTLYNIYDKNSSIECE